MGQGAPRHVCFPYNCCLYSTDIFFSLGKYVEKHGKAQEREPYESSVLQAHLVRQPANPIKASSVNE